MELGTETSYKAKKELSRMIQDNGGIVSFTITPEVRSKSESERKGTPHHNRLTLRFLLPHRPCCRASTSNSKTTHVVVDASKTASYKAKSALKRCIPCVSPAYIAACVAQESLLQADDFLAVGKSANDQFRTGKIASSGPAAPGKRLKRALPSVDIESYTRWKFPHSEDAAPVFPDNYEIARFALLNRIDNESGAHDFACLEIHVAGSSASSSSNSSSTKLSRVFCHYGSVDNLIEEEEAASADVRKTTRECLYAATPLEAERLYAALYQTMIDVGSVKASACVCVCK